MENLKKEAIDKYYDINNKIIDIKGGKLFLTIIPFMNAITTGGMFALSKCNTNFLPAAILGTVITVVSTPKIYDTFKDCNEELRELDVELKEIEKELDILDIKIK